MATAGPGRFISLLENFTAESWGAERFRQYHLPDKVFWANINVGVYALPPAELRRWVRERVQAAAPDGRGLAFEVSEDLPANWRTAVPVVLETLKKDGACR